jgi:hypothetical protein
LDYDGPFPFRDGQFSAGDLTLTFGSLRADGKGGQVASVKRIVRGEEDLALLELDAPVSSASPVRLSDRVPPQGYNIKAVGWGGGTGSDALEQADMRVSRFDSTPSWWHPSAMGLAVPDASSNANGGVQKGDSGGPILVPVQSGGYALAGVIRAFANAVEDYRKTNYGVLWSRADAASGSFEWIRSTAGTVQTVPVAVPYGPFPPVAQPPPPDNLPAPYENAPPVAAFTYARKAGAGNIVAFDGRGSTDKDGSVVAWQWRIGSTVIGTGATPTIALGARTSAEVILRVTDNWGTSAETRRILSLGNRAPVIASLTPNGAAVVGSNTPVLAATASDPDADSLQYRFTVSGTSVSLDSEWVGRSWQIPPHRLDPGGQYTWKVTVRDPSGSTASRSSNFTVAMLPTASDTMPTSSGKGYWQVASDGGVFSYGDAGFHGSLPGIGIHQTNIMGMARTPDDGGYWLVGTDGGVFSFGDAGFYGSLPGINVHVDNIVGMAATKTGHGYWLVGSDGGVFAFGDAGFYGSMGDKPLNKPVTSILPTRSGNGYWIAAQDGGIFSFGDAPFYGSLGSTPLNAPVVDMDANPDGGGYWMTAEDGGVFAFGNAKFYGSMANQPLNGHITGMAVTATGRGYSLNGCDGGVFAFGDAHFLGSNPTYQCRGTL